MSERGERSPVADIDQYGLDLAERLLAVIDPIDGGFGLAVPRAADLAARQLLWARYMVTGAPRFRDGVLPSLRATCRSHRDESLSGNAQILELLTWVWRVERCPELRQCVERIARLTVDEMRVPGFGFAAGIGAEDVRADGNGLMLVALVEAGSVFERRDWLALAREVFDELVGHLADSGTLWHDVARGAPGFLDDYAMMSRAAIRLFEAFGKRRYLEHAEAWVAMLDVAFWDVTGGGYDMSWVGASAGTSRERSIADGASPSGNALMVGVLARLHSLTEASRYAARAGRLVEAFHGDIKRSGIAAATAIANVLTVARLVSIKISGDPKLSETRELMRIALDCGLPDRLVLGPGAGGTPGERPRALIRVGAQVLAPISEPSRFRTLLAAGGLDVPSLERNS